MKNMKYKIDQGNMLGGFFLIGLSIFEFSTFYFTDNYLAPYLDSELLRNIISIGLFPIIMGLWGIQNIYTELQRYLNCTKINNNDASSSTLQKNENTTIHSDVKKSITVATHSGILRGAIGMEEVIDDDLEILFEDGEEIPCEVDISFDGFKGQEKIKVLLYQGDNTKGKDSVYLGAFLINAGMKAKSKGVVIYATICIDNSGALVVSAKNKSSSEPLNVVYEFGV